MTDCRWPDLSDHHRQHLTADRASTPVPHHLLRLLSLPRKTISGAPPSDELIRLRSNPNEFEGGPSPASPQAQTQPERQHSKPPSTPTQVQKPPSSLSKPTRSEKLQSSSTEVRPAPDSDDIEHHRPDLRPADDLRLDPKLLSTDGGRRNGVHHEQTRERGETVEGESPFPFRISRLFSPPCCFWFVEVQRLGVMAKS